MMLAAAVDDERQDASWEGICSLLQWPDLQEDVATNVGAACKAAEEVSARQAAIGVRYAQEWLVRLVFTLIGAGLKADEHSFRLLYAGPGSLNISTDDGRVRLHSESGNDRLVADRLLVLGKSKPTGMAGFVDGDDGKGCLFAITSRGPSVAGEPIQFLGLNELTFQAGKFDGSLESGDSLRSLGSQETAFIRAELQAAAAVLWGAVCLGIARAAVDWALDYSTQRTAFGKPICQHQAVALKLADSVMSIESARSLLHDMSASGSTAWPNQVTFAQVYAADQAFGAVLRALRVAGGHGYLRRNPVEHWLRDVQTLRLLARPSQAR